MTDIYVVTLLQSTSTTLTPHSQKETMPDSAGAYLSFLSDSLPITHFESQGYMQTSNPNTSLDGASQRSLSPKGVVKRDEEFFLEWEFAFIQVMTSLNIDGVLY